MTNVYLLFHQTHEKQKGGRRPVTCSLTRRNFKDISDRSNEDIASTQP